MADVTITLSDTLSPKEITSVLNESFNQLIPEDEQHFDEQNGQSSLEEWFDLDALALYIPNNGVVIEARTGNNVLVGVAIVGKQHPLTWPDGQKAELFMLGVLPAYRSQGVGGKLLREAEEQAHNFGAKKILLNTHSIMSVTVKYYESRGYQRMGELVGYYENGNAIFLGKKI